MSLIAAFGSVALDAHRAPGAGQRRRRSASRSSAGWARALLDRCGAAAGGELVIALHETTASARRAIRRDFVANISHELRTPLASIKLLAETLSEGAVDDPQTAADFTLQIEREVDHLAQLVEELLDLSMIESGETKLGSNRSSRGAGPRRGRAHRASRRTRRGMTVVADPGVRAGGSCDADAGRLGQALPRTWPTTR